MTDARRRRARREDGLTTIGAILIFALVALTGGIVLTGKLAVATSQGGRAQAGADAAALAGAKAVLEQIPTDLAPGFLLPTDIPQLLGGGTCVQTGRVEAERLAAANGDALTSYCYDVYRDEISVGVRTVDDTAMTARADATAATTFDATACSLPAGFTPTEPSDPDDVPDVQKTLLDCGISALTIVYNPVDSRFHFVDLALQLADVQPRLTR